MTLLISRTSAILGVGLGLGLSLFPTSPFRSAPIQCQYTAPYPRSTTTEEPTDSGWAIDAQDPLLRKQGATGPSTAGNGIFTTSNMRQVSLGSVLGLVAGVGLRAFSKALVVLLGMGVVLVEWAAAKGYNILPLQKMQRYVKGVDLQKAVSRQIPFKLSFGATMALAAFAQF